MMTVRTSDGPTPAPHCFLCKANHGVIKPAEFVAAQSEDQGKNIDWVMICADHADGWNEGSDWTAPMFAMIEFDEQTAKEIDAILTRMDREIPLLEARLDALLGRYANISPRRSRDAFFGKSRPDSLAG